MMNGKRFSKDKARRNGFYAALTVCLVAVGVAAWSTYDAVQSYSNAGAEDFSSLNGLRSEMSRAELPDEDPERPRSTPVPRPTPAPTPAPTAAPSRPASGSLLSGADTSDKDRNVSEPESDPVHDTEPDEEPMVPVTAPLYERSAQMIHPLSSGKVIKAYSAGAPVYSATMKDWRIHTGADELAEAGEDVRACANGLVRRTYVDRMLGNVIVIEHGDYVFSYCGVGENFLVHEGDVVTKGQIIGTVTAVPSEAADEVHLHLEVLRDNVFVDPIGVIAEIG